MDLKKTSIKKPLKIDMEVKDGKVYIIGTTEVENLYIAASKVISIEDIIKANERTTNS